MKGRLLACSGVFQVFALIPHVSFLIDIFQILLAINNHLSSSLYFKVQFDRVLGNMFNDAHLKDLETNYIKDAKQKSFFFQMIFK